MKIDTTIALSEIKIYNFLWQKIKSLENVDSKTVNVSDFNSGTYLIKTVASKGVTQKFIKE